MPEPVSKAFLFVVNYLVALEIVQSSGTVFMVENYHHAVCALNVCEKIGNNEEISSLSPSVFEWPFDLPKPELVIFLSIPTETRLQRIKTCAKDERMHLVYSMVRGPGTVGLDASLSAEDVTFTALEALEYYGVYDISRVYDPSSPVPPTPPPRPPRRSKGATRTSNIYPSDETHAENETETERSDNSHLDMLDTIDEVSPGHNHSPLWPQHYCPKEQD
eukprot:CAMPEP_0176302828 /NCGR_PEP_ID=MMETSP0121_2-20121125/61590_1 /TAXON_ID=160619 /ORGANISM="Kryptoperidinium foliaceum, Strain CCMP 1326" /LENGTH=218 /DNA_ID=CAMNT_0017644363 /DNA_START=179 /DNA_END=835 /DNA_ORIENTATION=+